MAKARHTKVGDILTSEHLKDCIFTSRMDIIDQVLALVPANKDWPRGDIGCLLVKQNARGDGFDEVWATVYTAPSKETAFERYA